MATRRVDRRVAATARVGDTQAVREAARVPEGDRDARRCAAGTGRDAAAQRCGLVHRQASSRRARWAVDEVNPRSGAAAAAPVPIAATSVGTVPSCATALSSSPTNNGVEVGDATPAANGAPTGERTSSRVDEPSEPEPAVDETVAAETETVETVAAETVAVEAVVEPSAPVASGIARGGIIPARTTRVRTAFRSERVAAGRTGTGNGAPPRARLTTGRRAAGGVPELRRGAAFLERRGSISVPSSEDDSATGPRSSGGVWATRGRLPTRGRAASVARLRLALSGHVTAPESAAAGPWVTEPEVDLEEQPAVVPYGRIGGGTRRSGDQRTRHAGGVGRPPVTPRR